MLLCVLKVSNMLHYKRKSDLGKFPREATLAAVELVEKGKCTRKAAAMHGLNYKTLSRHMKVKSSSGSLDSASFGYVKVRQDFSKSMETEIVQYVIRAAQIFHGLTVTELRRLAFDLSVANDIRNMPRSWTELD